MQTVAQFAAACNNLTHGDIYELFEYDISQELRDEIYLTYCSNCPEPVREALNKIGVQYNVQSLVNY